MIHVSIVVHDDGHIGLEGHELKLTMWNAAGRGAHGNIPL